MGLLVCWSPMIKRIVDNAMESKNTSMNPLKVLQSLVRVLFFVAL